LDGVFDSQHRAVHDRLIHKSIAGFVVVWLRPALVVFTILWSAIAVVVLMLLFFAPGQPMFLGSGPVGIPT
jgi:hypothetical protein